MGGSRPDHNFRPKRYKFFLCFHSIQNLSKRENTHKKNLFGCTTPQKTCTFDHNWGRGGGVAILWWAPPKSTSFFFDVAPNHKILRNFPFLHFDLKPLELDELNLGLSDWLKLARIKFSPVGLVIFSHCVLSVLNHELYKHYSMYFIEKNVYFNLNLHKRFCFNNFVHVKWLLLVFWPILRKA